MPPLKVFNLGQLGVNIREGPLHLQDGELVSAQNAELSKDGAEDGLVKRGGIEEFSTAALASAALGIVSVPLPDLFPTLTLLVVNGTAWRSSGNGTTWSAFPSPSTPRAYHSFEGAPIGPPQLGGFLYYALDSTFPATQRANSFGVAAAGTIPNHSRASEAPALIRCSFAHDGLIYWGISYTSGDALSAVLSMDSDGVFTEVGTAFSQVGLGGLITGIVNDIVVFNDELYVLIDTITGSGKVYKMALGGSTWTLDDTESADNYPTGMIADETHLYVGYTSPGGGALGRIKRRTTGGTWTTPATFASGAGVLPVGSDGTTVTAWISLETFNATLKTSIDQGATWVTAYTAPSVHPQGGGGPLCSKIATLNDVEFLAFQDSLGNVIVLRNNSGWGEVESLSGGGSCILGAVS